ncbi:phosphatase PAP2 family protein [Marichromatium sp. AB31]|uniref:phosphatase PAP2 family protein n=1 Tax=Marichromatium sp. AB31 TaxID=2483362 RepID=UPI000F3B2378|nr:phosphatase PAP2 family protein [Marichromatium sp. AB31]RNE92084.1 phosphatase PAP2 family protein [Marichromatium sp. AB31]
MIARDLRGQLIVLAVVALLGTLPFWLSDLDTRLVSLFYHPGADDPWYEAQAPLWSALYVAAPLLTGLMMLGGLLVLIAAALWPRFRRLRIHAVFVIATALLGPGLIVNGVFKEQWDRPRPHQTEAFGGTQPYLPPLRIGDYGEGKSFPSGHASVGFVLGVFFLIWRRRRPLLAWMALAGSVAFGVLLGIGRMAAGDHFPSDVIWAWVFVYGTALLLYHGVLRVPRRERAAALAPPSSSRLRHPRLTALGYALAVPVMIAVVLVATPLKRIEYERIAHDEFLSAPEVLRIEADDLDVVLFWIGERDRRAQLRLEARGFGLPWSRVESRLVARDGVLSYDVVHRGLFTERDTKLALGVVADEWRRVEVITGEGDIRRYPAPPSVTLPELRLESAHGRVVEGGPGTR